MHNADIPSTRIPDDDHTVWSNAGCDNPAPIIAAARARDCIRLTQKKNKQSVKQSVACLSGLSSYAIVTTTSCVTVTQLK